MRNFQDGFETRKQSFINGFSVSITVPLKAFSSANLLNTALKILSVTFWCYFHLLVFEFETAPCNLPKIVQRKKYIKNVLMKTLNHYFPNFHIFMLHSFGLAAARIEILYQNISWLVSHCPTTTHKYWEEHDLILYFNFL